jgi:Tol biopolymer transport system component
MVRRSPTWWRLISGEIVLLRVMNANGTRDRHRSAGSGIPTWSPDGKYIIFSRERARIYLIKPDGSSERYIAKGIYPQWIP